MIKDRDLKELLYRHFRAQGWMAQIEVSIATEKGVSKNTPQVTDIDVLGIRPSAELKWFMIIGDCKTQRKLSPVNRVLWVRGLQEAIRASSSILLLKRDNTTQIERDHRLFADRLGVMLLQEDEFGTYARAILYPSGSSGFRDSIDDLEVLREELSNKFPKLKSFVKWITSESWAVLDHSLLLRQVLGQMRGIRGEIDPRRDDHLALICESTAVFGMAFASLVGRVFHGYLKPDQREVLDDAARMIIWGGRDQYEFYNSLRRQLIAAKGGDPEDRLALPKWDEFLELLRSFLEIPHLAFQIPQFLRSIAIGLMTVKTEAVLSTINNQMLLHLGLRLLLYVCHAAEFPSDAAEKAKKIIVARITNLTEGSSVKNPSSG